MNAMVLQFLLAAVPAVFAITLHEAAHGYAALALGDDTARVQGRLSLNPLRHVDDVGTLIVPGVLMLAQILTIGRISFVFGWAKPVPVSAWRFRDPRRGMMLVAAAGPLMNFGLAWLGALAMWSVGWVPVSVHDEVVQFWEVFIYANLVLGLFNLLPIPPLDGGRIMVGLLPERAAEVWGRLERAGIVIVVLTVFIMPRVLGEFGIVWDPVGHALNEVIPWAYDLVMGLAGHDPGS